MSICGGAVPSIRAAPSDFAVPAHDDLLVASRVQVRLPVFHDDPRLRDASSRTLEVGVDFLDRVERPPTPRSDPV
jgi:hypothetical protein